MELLRKAVPFAMLAFVVSSMLAMGLGLTVRQIVTPLRDYSLMARALLANFVLLPVAAVALGRLLRLDEPQAVGLVLLGAAAGAPFLPKLAQLARGDLGFAVGLMVLLMVITIGYLPLALPFMLPGVSVNSWAIARSLLLLMLLPLGVALGVNAWFPDIAARITPVLHRVSSLSLILLFILLVVVNFTSVPSRSDPTCPSSTVAPAGTPCTATQGSLFASPRSPVCTARCATLPPSTTCR